MRNTGIELLLLLANGALVAFTLSRAPRIYCLVHLSSFRHVGLQRCFFISALYECMAAFRSIGPCPLAAYWPFFWESGSGCYLSEIWFYRSSYYHFVYSWFIGL